MQYGKLNCKRKTDSKFLEGQGFLCSIASVVAFMLRVMIKLFLIVH
jgi:hypothetical protein